MPKSPGADVLWRLTVFRFNFSDYDESADQFNYDWRDIEALTQALSDNDNPLAKNLRRLRVRFYWLWTHEHVDDPKADIKALLKMLRVNRSLEFLDVHLPPPYHDCVDSLRGHQSGVRFLSVILGRYRVPELDTDKANVAVPRCAQSHLDECVLPAIFESAAPPAVYVRQVFDESWLAQEEDEIV
ncbi:hypothetical protein PHYSODRAFT_306184 [Phytophthora sojae]|uniref:Uncharacterized protein n=1 Tax=Phytophthora sojae (strain P6497) TaxID=1094619 RepID=G5A896_PHYSP|nr:hypothetical protein PHYSODRAFT_306184 [Phytophthora sojae]EGZ08122.1 hypothetical protein PHYSODRAFT_306184 [Phytophthora sojae]|eukprot:XP_009536294.1 hypothetical protein PHYSODRAFT_306184 [Phytophthora sojae]